MDRGKAVAEDGSPLRWWWWWGEGGRCCLGRATGLLRLWLIQGNNRQLFNNISGKWVHVIMWSILKCSVFLTLYLNYIRTSLTASITYKYISTGLQGWPRMSNSWRHHNVQWKTVSLKAGYCELFCWKINVCVRVNVVLNWALYFFFLDWTALYQFGNCCSWFYSCRCWTGNA